MKLRLRRFSWLLAAIALLLTGVGAFAGMVEDWGSGDGVTDAVNLSNSGDIRQPDLTIGESAIAVMWSGVGALDPDSQRGVFQAVGTSVPLSTTPPLTLTGAADTWAPNAVYAGDELRVAWVQGDYAVPEGRLLQQDATDEQAQELMKPIYGHTAPRLLTGETGDHLLIASADSRANFSKGNLYHIHRPKDLKTWLAPTMVLTHAQAALPSSGGIWYPHAVLNEDAQMLHVVWEQTIGTSRSVWYMSGTWQESDSAFDWGDFERLSVRGQTAVRPKVAVDAHARVHVTWVEQKVVSLNPKITLQYINYRRLEGGIWHPGLDHEAALLDKDPVQVNTYRPTWSTISMATLEDTICVAWHGYRAPPGDSGHEEIYLNCSKDGGKTWSDVITNASETPDRLSLFPTMMIDETEILHLAWEEHLGGENFRTNYDVYYRSGPVPDVKKLVYLPLTLRGAP